MIRFISLAIIMIGSSCENKGGHYGGFILESNSAVDSYIVLDQGVEIFGTSDSEHVKFGTKLVYFDSLGNKDTVSITRGATVVESFVNWRDVQFDNSFIVLRQIPLNSICECNESCLMLKYPNWKELPTYKICLEAVQSSSNYHYWIIDKLNNFIYGPLNGANFQSMMEKLEVSNQLNLNPAGADTLSVP